MKKLAILLASILALAAAALLWRSEEPIRQPAGQTADDRLALDRTVRRTFEESRTGVDMPPVVAAPFGPAADDSARPVQRPIAPSVAEANIGEPPEGYSPGAYRGFMQRAPRAGAGEPEPAPNPDWLEPASATATLLEQAERAGRDFTFAVLRVSPGTDRQVLNGLLAPLGAQIVGNSAEYARVRVRAEPGRLEAIAGIPGVLGIGAVPPGLKAEDAFAQDLYSRSASEPVPVFITLMAPDPAGEWRRALSRLGVVVGAYDPDLRSYTANMPAAALANVVAADFVLSVEPVPVVQGNHASAMPVMGVDAFRRYDSAAQAFTGVDGSGIAVGVLDTGLNTAHMDIAHGRASICGSNFIADENWDLWLDLGDHGTHVFGTIAAAGRSDPRLAGVAPNLSHLRFGKILSAHGYGSGDDIRRGMDYLSRPSSCLWQGVRSDPVKPHIVNMSLSATSLRFSGRGVGERKLDSIVHAHSQLYVVAQSNAGVHGFSNYGTAKNSLAVGAVDDAGILAVFSSHGPTADGRLAPNVVGTGVQLTSARGGGSISAHHTFSGTSMAAPSVAGVAALLMQARPEFRNRPALTRARLMASAIRPHAYLESRVWLPADNSGGPGGFNNLHGLGLVSARTSLFSHDDPRGWLIGSASSRPDNDAYEYIDIEVPQGARRLDVVLTWDEQPADTLTRSVLNNLDLWADQNADCEREACGEHASRSGVDNVEWLLIEDPVPGTYRIKVVPVEVYGESSTAAVAWTILLGDAAPALELELADTSAGDASEYLTVDVTVGANHFVASGTTLHLGCRKPPNHVCDALSTAYLPQRSRVHREDGLDWSEPYSARGGHVRPIPIGEVTPGTPKRVQLSFLREAIPAGIVLTVTASSWNARAAGQGLAFGEAADSGSTVPEIPSNDNFSASERLEGATGERALDLALASREPGEPPLNSAERTQLLGAASSRTVWYTWEAPDKGLFRFRLKDADSGDTVDAAFALFTGNALVELDLVAEKQGNEISFAADAGALYRLRISSEKWDLPPLALQWESADSRPANDDFAHAQVIEGESGSVDASNEGATLEGSEFLGGAAATVWFAWTAPDDGAWVFRNDSDQLIVRVYEGTSVDALRLLSMSEGRYLGFFKAVRGETYRIAVASRSADDSGSRFTLTWFPDSTDFDTADHFADAVTLEGAQGHLSLPLPTYGFTVEPGEPVAAGIATAWLQWTAPTRGRFTWRLEGPSTLQFTVFTGSSLSDLQLVGSARGGSALALHATGDSRYWIAVGRSPDSTGERQRWALAWGPTPANDDRAAAIPISGAAGSVEAAGLAHATASPQDPPDIAGTDSVWWQWRAPAGGWHRFRVREDPLSTILSVYPGNGRQATATSERSFVANGRVEAWVPARAGQTYDIRLSARPGVEKTGSATIVWETSDAPAFLAYKGATATDYLVLDAEPQALLSPANLAMSEDGEYLFSTADNGLFAFRRDAVTEELVLARRLEPGTASNGVNLDDLRRASLWWNTRLSRLFAVGQRNSHSFAVPDDGSSWLSHGRVGGFEPHSSFWYVSYPVIGSLDGRYLYETNRYDYLRVYRVDSPTQFTLVQTVSSGGTGDTNPAGTDSLVLGNLHTPVDAALSPDGAHLYLVAETGLFAFSIDPESGRLNLTSEILTDGAPGSPFYEMTGLEGVAVDRDGTVLFVSGKQRSHRIDPVAAFDVSTDPSNPRHLDTLTRTHAESDLDATRSWSHLFPFRELYTCRRIFPHADLPAVDVFCYNGYYVVSWNRETASLEVTDFAVAGDRDRFGNTLPYGLGTRRLPAASPDGGHVYVATSILNDALPDAIHVFQRASAMEFDSDAPPAPARAAL